jgi:hypothetical protein
MFKFFVQLFSKPIYFDMFNKTINTTNNITNNITNYNNCDPEYIASVVKAIHSAAITQQPHDETRICAGTNQPVANVPIE